MDFTLHAIGVIHSPFTAKEQTPIQSSRSPALGSIEIAAEYADGLQDIEGFSHLILLYFFHRSSGFELKIKPFLDDHLRGVFATRHPCRPNPLGLSIVRLIRRSEKWLEIEGVDVLDGTPLLDIKPYIPDFDIRTDVRTGWFDTRSKP